MRQVLLYLRTLRFLKFSQVWFRIWRYVWTPRLDLVITPQKKICSGEWKRPPTRMQSLFEGFEFKFLNQAGYLRDVGWAGEERSILWRYNQHYFDDLNATNSESRFALHIELIDRWISDNPPTAGVAWEPYPTSLRIVNWIKWSLSGRFLNQDQLTSLALQSRWLRLRLERHLLGNHLFANGKALVFAGAFFNGAEAQEWLSRGVKIITREVDEQILADGGNFELSPMYHSIFLEDLLDLINLENLQNGVLGADLKEKLKRKASKMLSWLSVMCHSDGQISFFNDAAFGVAVTPTQLEAYAESLGVYRKLTASKSIQHLKASGYIRVNVGDMSAILDVAPVGPAYLPGHAHADTLSFELSLGKDRVIVNGGTSEYGVGSTRQRERGTKNHSTVEVNFEDSSEVWHGFRVARRARPKGLTIEECASSISIACSHDGYERLMEGALHTRAWTVQSRSVKVTDSIEAGNFVSVSRFHFHPHIGLEQRSASLWDLLLPSGLNMQLQVLSGEGFMRDAIYSPEFGVQLATTCLEVELMNNRSCVELIW